MGGEYSEYWMQVIYKSRQQFYNSTKLNEDHVKFLCYVLTTSFEIPFIPIVVFNNDAELEILIGNHIVLNRCDLKRIILQFQIVTLSNK